jgi:hypothetical protein
VQDLVGQAHDRIHTVRLQPGVVHLRVVAHDDTQAGFGHRLDLLDVLDAA